jgi:hypothetical protein
MIKSVLPQIKKISLIFSILLAGAVSYCFVAGVEPDWLSWGNKCLAQSYDPSNEVKLKKWELVLTDDSFIRLRKFYQNGKQEYYSFHLHRLDDINYLGDTNTGILQLKAKTADIIVQTYNDRKGNVDSMASVLSIPVKNMQPERLDSLREALNYFKMKNL